MAVDTKSRLLRDAEKFVFQGKIPQAIAEYQRVVKNDPSDVLTLNTVGDLYLRLGRVSEANHVFVQVAEAYTRNNFLLKAIAVYKKILKADPQNFEINQTLAQLYAKQGLSVDARNQYLHVAEICTREGKLQESLDAYEKAVAMDPANSAVQIKLAEIYLGAEGGKDKAQIYFAGAGRAQAKAGNHAGAANSFRRSLELNPIDAETLRGFLDSSRRISDLAPVVERIKNALSIVPDSVELREMLGEAHLSAGDLKSAALAFEMTLAVDESRYEHFFDVAKAFFETGNLDAAAAALDPIFPKLISRRETDRAAALYEQILEKDPCHIPALSRLSDIYSAINDQLSYIDTLHRIAVRHLQLGAPKEALPPLEKILAIAAEDKYLQLHREAFTAAFPETPYSPPVEPESGRREPPLDISGDARDSVQKGDTKFVEIDLLLGYGMTEKALEMLQELAAKDPSDREVHSRLASVFRESSDPHSAAEQCAILAALERRANNEEAARKHMAEARKLDPQRIDSHFDLAAFARQHGIELTISGPDGSSGGSGLEVDLSGDLSDIFFKGAEESPQPEEPGPSPSPDEFVEEYGAGVPTPQASQETLEDQLQEVDFYIRLGFADEARAKLDEIARLHSGHPELRSRYDQLARSADSAPAAAGFPQTAPEPVIPSGGGSEPEDLPEPFLDLGAQQEDTEVFSLEQGTEGAPEAAPAAEPEATVPGGTEPEAQPPVDAAAGDGQVNAMFADLIDEVNALTDREIAREDFETHFTLGTAYREMALVDDAITEFQAAFKALDGSKSRKEAVRCCGMLSTCYLEKEMPRSAIRWCQTGLRFTEISSHEALALRYDMGVAHTVTGDSERALQCFGEIFGIDPSYRDVAQRIDDLKNGPGRHVP